MEPGCAAMLARAEAARARLVARVLTPYEAARALLCDDEAGGEAAGEGGEEIEVLDVRTQAQREQHGMNERGPSVMWVAR